MKKTWRILAALIAALAMSAALLWAESGAGRGLHNKIYVVPAPRPVAIDGKLDDWDLSGQILIYAFRETAEMQSARIALMYDAEAFYVSGVIRDPSPMMNRHDPQVEADKAWDADVCQIFINLDPGLGYPLDFTSRANSQGKDKDLANLILWYYTDRQEPCLAITRTMKFKAPAEYPNKGVVPADKFQAAYVKAEDPATNAGQAAQGYTFEYRIPWATLGAPRPLKGGDLTAGAIMLFWSTPDGMKTAGGSAHAYDVLCFAGFPFQNSGTWGKFIFTDKGNIARELVEEGLPPEQPLPLKFTYDLPEDGFATVQLFKTNGMVARLLVAQSERKAGKNIELWDGLDDEGKPLPAGTYSWRGLYHQGITTKFCFSVHNSGQPPYKTDDNTGGWGADHGTPTAVYAAGSHVFLAWNICESGWGIIRTDLNGRKQWGSKHNAYDLTGDSQRLFVTGDDWFADAHSVKPFAMTDGRPLNWGNGKSALDPLPGDISNNVASGVAYANGKLYVSWEKRNLIGVYDAESGNLKETWPVPAPRRLAIGKNGQVAVISGESVIIAGKQGVISFINHQPSASAKATADKSTIDHPTGLVFDADGNLYVANAGKLQNVSVFNPKGRYLRSIGKPGGRPARGRYDPNGMYMPGGIAVSRDGKLWVAETTDSPKRFSVWDVKTAHSTGSGQGAFVNEFFGGSAYFGWAYMDPKKPDEIYCHNVLWKIDWTNNTCSPYSTIWRATEPDMVYEANPNGYAGHFRVMTAKNGKQFGWGMSDYSPMLYMREGDIFKPIAGSIRVAMSRGPGIRYPAMKNFHARHKAAAYLWQDANDDQKVQENELTVSPAANASLTFNWIDEELNAWCDAGFIFQPVSFAPDGRPIYDFSRTNTIPFKGRNASATSLWLDPADSNAVYTLNPGTMPGFARWTRDGSLVWGFCGIRPWNQSLNLNIGTPGKLYGLTMPLGVAGEFTGAACYASPYYIFTTDGLYVAMIMRNCRDGKLGPDITTSETIEGQLVKPDGMSRYFLLAGDQDGRVTEVLGLDTVQRIPNGTLTLSEADVKLAADALKDYQAKLAKAQKLTIVRGKLALPGAPAVSKTVDSVRSFSARAAYDATNLYLQFEVNGSDLVNTFADHKLVFKGGNCLDIQLAADPQADPKRKKPVPGDVRILVTRQEGKPLAMIYRPKIGAESACHGVASERSRVTVPAGTAQPFRSVAPTVLNSPTGKESFDGIENNASVGLTYKKRGMDFQALVTVPLAVVQWTPKPGATVRMDVGYIFGNPNGNQAAARAYWSNSSFSAGVVNDVPTESRLEPAEWGEAVVE